RAVLRRDVERLVARDQQVSGGVEEERVVAVRRAAGDDIAVLRGRPLPARGRRSGSAAADQGARELEVQQVADAQAVEDLERGVPDRIAARLAVRNARRLGGRQAAQVNGKGEVAGRLKSLVVVARRQRARHKLYRAGE